MLILPGSTSQKLTVQIVDDTGLPVTGLVAATFPTLKGFRSGEAETAFPSLSDLAAIGSAFSAGGVKEYSGGYYRLDAPNTLWATANKQVLIKGEAADKHVICSPIEVRANIVPWLTLNIKTTAGTYAEFMAGLSNDGVHVDIYATDPAATCAIACYIIGSAIPLFSIATGTVGAPKSHHGLFEAEYNNPGFTADRGHVVIATITYLGVTYKASTPFTPFP